MNERKRRFSFVSNARDLEKFESVRRWLSRVRQDGTGSDITSYTYLRHLNFYCGYLEKNPDQLIEERERELKSEQEKVKHHAEEKLREFCDYIEREAKLSGATMKSIFGAIKSFYKANYQPLQMETPVRATKQILPAKREEILKILHYADVREKAIILAFKDSGISREDLVTLKYGDIQDEFEKGIVPIRISLVRGKEQVRYETFFGEDFIKAYKEYLEFRKRKGESIIGNSPLFLCKYENKPRGLAVDGLAEIMWRLRRESGADVTPHGLRKFFITSVSLGLPKGSPAYLPKYWAGHSLGVEAAYFIPPVEEQRKAYSEAYPSLSLFEAKATVADERQIKLEIAKKMCEVLGLGELTPEIRIDKNVMTVDDEIAFYERLINKRKTEHNGGSMANGAFKIIGENELVPLLEQGYEIVRELSNGKIVVKKPGNCLF